MTNPHLQTLATMHAREIAGPFPWATHAKRIAHRLQRFGEINPEEHATLARLLSIVEIADDAAALAASDNRNDHERERVAARDARVAILQHGGSLDSLQAARDSVASILGNLDADIGEHRNALARRIDALPPGVRTDRDTLDALSRYGVEPCEGCGTLWPYAALANATPGDPESAQVCPDCESLGTPAELAPEYEEPDA